METENQSPVLEEASASPSGHKPPAEERFRPAPRPQWAWLIAALLVGLGPALAAAFWLWQQADELERRQGQRLEAMTQQLENNQKLILSLRQSLSLGAKKLLQLSEHNRRLEQEAAAERLREKVLAPLKGKTSEEIAEEPQLKKQLERLPEITALVFFEGGDVRPVRTFPESLASNEQLRSELQQALAGSAPGDWRFSNIAESTVRVAWKFRPAPAIELPGVSLPAVEISPVPLQELQHDLARLQRESRLVLMLAPAAGLLLGLGLFLGLRRRWWLPLRNLTRQAEQLLEGRPLSWEKNGGVGDELATSLERLQQRLERLAKLENWQEQTRREAALVEEALVQVARNGPPVRLPRLEGDLVLVGQALRRLMETWESQLQGLALAATRLQSFAESLRKTAGELLAQIPDDRPPADQQAVCQMLTISMDSLRQALRELSVAPPPNTAPPTADGQKLAEAATTIEELSALLGSLAGQVSRLQEAQALLHTQLALAERDGAANQEILQLAVRLRQETESIYSGLQLKTSRLQQAAYQNRQQSELLLEAWSRLSQEYLRQLEHCRKQSEKAGALLDRMRALEPISNTLAGSFSSLFELAEQRGRLLGRLQQAIRHLAEMANQLGELGRVAARDIEQLSGRSAEPAAFSQELAASHSALERALRLLEENLQRNDLRPLEPQTEKLLQQIQQTASAARARLEVSVSEGGRADG